MKKIFSLSILSVLLVVFSFGKLSAQVTIGADVAPKPSSVLELHGQYKSGIYGGLRLPQLTTLERNAITGLTAPEAKGLMIFNTDINCAEVYNGTAWKSLCNGGTGGGTGGTGDTPGTWNGIECKAKISATEWKKFMCRNLGADPNADPITPSNDLYGEYYQWGSKTPIANRTEKYNTTYPWTAPTGWYGVNSSTIVPEGEKSFFDPCPAGYRVPNTYEWRAVRDNNTIVWISAGANSGYMVGPLLFLPAAGWYRDNDGQFMYDFGPLAQGRYWSQEHAGATSGGILLFNAGGGMSTPNHERASGLSIRCIAID